MKLVKCLVFLLVGRIIRFKFCILYLRLKYKEVAKMSLQRGIIYFIHECTFKIKRDFSRRGGEVILQDKRHPPPPTVTPMSNEYNFFGCILKNSNE